MNITNPNTVTNLIYDVLMDNHNKHKGMMFPYEIILKVVEKSKYGTIDESFIVKYNRAIKILRSQGSIVYDSEGVKIGLSRSAMREGF